MATTALVLELPKELVERFGSKKEAVARLKEAMVLELLREAELSQDQVAKLLAVSRRDALGFRAQLQTPSGPETAEKVAEEMENHRSMHRARRAHGSR
jgi:hypothetical protein